MSITLQSIDQVWQDETTNYWFLVDGESYAVSDNYGLIRLLDCDGYPIEGCNDHDRILDKLTHHYEQERDSV